MTTAAPPPARVQVVAQEFAFSLSRRTIKTGDAIVELVNQGQDAHDLRMKRNGGTRVYTWPVVQAGNVRRPCVPASAGRLRPLVRGR